MQSPPFARSVKSHIDRFLHVATGFFQHLAHLARHVLRELFFAFDQNLAEPVKYLRALRRGRGSPFRKCFARGVDSGVNIFRGRSRKYADDVARVSRVAVLIIAPFAAFTQRPPM